MDFFQVIESTRDKLRRAQAAYGQKSWREDRVRKPLILYVIRDHRFDPQFRDQRKLLERGRVVWGAVVQANQILFQPNGPHPMLPAAIMYSIDSAYDSDPGQLVEHAHKLFELKGEECAPEMQAFADKLADEMVADVKLPIPRGFTGGTQCYYATVVIPRKHLPGDYLANQFFPVLVHPEETDAVMVLPRAYWDARFKLAWADL